MEGMWPMIILMVIFSYVVVSNVMLTLRNGVYQHVNKAYMAFLMGSIMGIEYYMIMIWNGNHTKKSWYGLLIWTIISIVLIILIRKQALVTDKEYLKGMIEHHDMAILMSDEIIKKSNDLVVRNFATNIIQAQQGEIEWMKKYLE